MKRILSIDGGGVLGIIPLTVLKKIEERLGKPLYEVFDLITGSSIGAVIGGALCSGEISCNKLHSTMVTDFQKIFKKRIRIPVLQPKYSKKAIKQSLDAQLSGLKMNQCKTKFFCTSINYIDGRTHFFKSWEDKDGQLDLTAAIIRSVSAPLYFGKEVDKVNKNVWIDGGCGDMNDPSMQAYMEARRQNWLQNEKVHIISLGCGQTPLGVPFEKSSKFNNAQEVAYYINIEDGGLGRAQTLNTHEVWLRSFAEENPNFTYQRIEEYNFPKSKSKLDAVKYIPDFINYGEKLSIKVDYDKLQEN